MKKIREWAFPAGLLLAWLIASTYTLSALLDAHNEHERVLRPGVSAPRT